MKAITIKQPWVSLIVHGIKDIENRTWACPKKYIGQRVLIHASANSWTWHKVINYLTDSMADILMELGYNGEWLRNLPTGCIIGSVEIVDCVINHPSIWAEKTDIPLLGDVLDDIKLLGKVVPPKKVIYNWVFANPILFKEPIPAKGKLSFWEFDGELPFEELNPTRVLKRIK